MLMEKDELIIKILAEDLKFHQMTLALKPLKIGHEYSLDLVSIVVKLMLADKAPTDNWLNTYADFMNRADECHFWNDLALKTMATECYNELKTCGVYG